MPWHEYYIHDCNKMNREYTKTRVKGAPTPVCKHCGANYETIQE